MPREVYFPKLIVNADDFGMSSSVNDAILRAFHRGLISRASIMANMPGFDEACDLARRFQLEGRIGIHLNITEGRPLSTRIAECTRFCNEDGLFRGKRRAFILSNDEKLALAKEFQAQIGACMDRDIQPSYLDSHEHCHTEWAIGTVAIRIARKYGIRAIRLSKNCGPSIDLTKRLYKAIYNQRLRLHGFAGTRHFGSVGDVCTILGDLRGDVEIMVHPCISAGGIIADGPNGEELQTLLRDAGILDAVKARASCPI